MNIDELQAGRELDALVAERVMGWTIKCEQVPDIKNLDRCTRKIALYTVVEGNGTKWSPCHSLDSVGLPYYSTNMGDAWLVVEKLKQRPKTFVRFIDAIGYLCDALDYLYPNGVVYATIESISPLIICQAALEIVEARVASYAIKS